tara:strand:- start:233 stop:589 length:357 start_codon:yes stop_codon:yes gene_type:complete
MTEKKRLYDKAYREANRDKQLAYRLANKEKAAAYDKIHNKIYREAQKDGLFTVYCLPKENYVGITDNLHRRLINHKSNSNRNTTDAYILGKYATRKEALTIEASYHAKGYLGRNSTYK